MLILKWAILRENMDLWAITGLFVVRKWGYCGRKVGLGNIWVVSVQDVDRMWGER